MTLPGMSGTEAAPVLKRLLPQVRIVLFTMHTEGVNQALAATFDIDVVIAKSDSITNLKEHLNALLKAERPPLRAEDLRNTKIN